MTLQRQSRGFGSDSPSARIAAKRRYRRARRTSSVAEDAAILTFLSEVLVGDHSWTLPEVQRLVAFREHADLGLERERRFEDSGTSGV